MVLSVYWLRDAVLLFPWLALFRCQGTAIGGPQQAHWSNDGLMLANRRRRWASINPSLGERLMFVEKGLSCLIHGQCGKSLPRVPPGVHTRSFPLHECLPHRRFIIGPASVLLGKWCTKDGPILHNRWYVPKWLTHTHSKVRPLESPCAPWQRCGIDGGKCVLIFTQHCCGVFFILPLSYTSTYDTNVFFLSRSVLY